MLHVMAVSVLRSHPWRTTWCALIVACQRDDSTEFEDESTDKKVRHVFYKIVQSEAGPTWTGLVALTFDPFWSSSHAKFSCPILTTTRSRFSKWKTATIRFSAGLSQEVLVMLGTLVPHCRCTRYMLEEVPEIPHEPTVGSLIMFFCWFLPWSSKLS